MLSFASFMKMSEERLDERLIMLNNGKKYNQVLILAGGAGSGKGFALSNFVESSNYKVRDVDEIKKLLQKLSAYGKLDVKKLWDTDTKTKAKYLKSPDFTEADLAEIEKTLTDARWKLNNLDLKNPKHVFALHMMTDIIGWKNKTLQLLKSTIPVHSQHKPNLAFDATTKNIESVNKTIKMVTDIGYDPANIHLVWILTDYKIAIENNLGRSRIVPENIMLQTHKGAAETMTDLLDGNVPVGLDGAIWTVLNNRENTVFWQHGDGKLRGTPEFHEKSDNQKLVAKVDQSKYDRIYGAGSFAKRNKRSRGDFEKEHTVVKSFTRIQVKKPGKALGQDVLPYKEQLFAMIIKNIPAEAKTALRTAYGILFDKSRS